MSVVTSQLDAVKVAIADGLALRSGLSGVAIFTAFLGLKDLPRESIQLSGPDEIEQPWADIGRLARNETLTLRGFVMVMQPGAGETVIRAVRARGIALLAEIQAFVVGDVTIGGLVRTSNFTMTRSDEGVTPDGRDIILEFNVVTTNRLTGR